jgi:hypothetical protein
MSYCKTEKRLAPRPRLTEPITVAKFFANRRHDAVVVISLFQFEDGPPILDLRRFFVGPDGIMRPSRKGLAIAVVRAPDLLDGLARAVKTARRLGFLRGGGDE